MKSKTDSTASVDDSDPAACCTASHELPDDAIDEDVHLLSAVGNKTRYETLRYIAGAGDEGACVCELPPLVGVSQGTISTALSRLHEAGLLDRRKDGRWRYYTTTESAERLLATLDSRREAANE